MNKKPTKIISLEDHAAKGARNFADHSKRLMTVVDAMVEIWENPDKAEIAFMARQFIQCTMPHSNPGDVTAWVRDNGDYQLVIQPDYDAQTMRNVGVPFGTVPRLVLFHLITEAVRTGKRQVHLGDSFGEFIEKVGLSKANGSGKRSDRRRVQEQTERLIRSQFTFQMSRGSGEKGAKAFKRLNVADGGVLWWNHGDDPDQANLFESVVELSEGFFKAATEAPVPGDLRALRALKGSALALDLYMWANYKTHIQSQKGKSVFVPWRGLELQLGASYTRPRAFRAKALEALKLVYSVSPGLNIEIEENALGGGLRVYPGKTAILPKS